MASIQPYGGKPARAVRGPAYRRGVALPAPPGVDTNAGPAEGASVDGAVEGDLESDSHENLAIDTGPGDRADDEGDDKHALSGAAAEGQLQLASPGVLPDLAELPEREAAYARAVRADNTLRRYRSD